MRFDITKFLVSSAAVTGIVLFMVSLNEAACEAVCYIVEKTVEEMQDPPVKPERYPAEEPGY